MNRLGRPLSVAALALAALAAAHLGSPLMDGRGDPDLWWHLLYGQRMLQDGAIPRTDWLSWSFSGQSYLVTQWAGQWLLAAVHRLAGAPGLAVLTWAVALGIIILAWRSCLVGVQQSQRPLALAVSAAVLAPLWDIYARPQIFGFATMAAIVWLASRAMHRGRWTREEILILGAAMALWVNFHGSYSVGLAYLGLVSVAVVAEQWVFGRQRPHLSWLIAPIVGLVSTLANPYGVGAWIYVVEIAGLQSTRLGVISEWQPTSMGSSLGASFLVAVLATATTMTQARPRIASLAVFLGMTLFGLVASRHAYFSIIALVPLLMASLAQTSASALLAPVMAKRMSVALVAATLAGALALGWWLNVRREAAVQAWQARIFPVAALEFLQANPIEGRVFNEISAGGWLAYHWRKPVAIDGRLDLYGDRWFFGWLFARNGGPQWRQFVQSSQATVFILQTQSALAQLLAHDPAYAVVFSDRSYSVILVRGPSTDDIIAVHARGLERLEVFGPKGEVALPPMGF
jgi:hypothetical protein